jgi:TRAP-type C4-dicarboxylate transport system substrate-binding protein
MRVTRLLSVFQTRDEAVHVMNRLEPTFEAEARQAGFVMAGSSGLGPDILFVRAPVKTLAELKKLKLWRWNIDEIGSASARAMGLDIVTTSVDEAARAFDEGRVDGFMTDPSVAVAFQWFTQARYVLDLRTTYLWGCLLVRESSFARLPIAFQEALREGTAEMRERNEEAAQRIDEALLSGLFAKQGVKMLPVSDSFRAEFFAAARRARELVAERFVLRELLVRVQGLLADYRAEHPEVSR